MTPLVQRTAGSVFWASGALLVYVHIGYPALLGLAARNRSVRSSTRSDVPEPLVGTCPEGATVSIVISAFDEAASIGRKLEETLGLDAGSRAIEVIVVADGSGDATPRIARDFDDPRVTVLHDPVRRGKAAAMNRGVAAATGDVLVFSDANNSWEHGALTALLEVFDDPEIGGATGLKTIARTAVDHAQSEGWYWKYESWIRERESTIGSCTAANGEIMAVRRRCFLPIPEDTVVDDLHLALEVMRRGMRFVAVPSAVSVEPPSPSEAGERERRARMSAGRARLLARRSTFASLPWCVRWQLVSHKAGRLAVPLALGAVLAGSIVSSFGPSLATRTAARVAVAAQVAIYGAVATSPLLVPRLPAPLRPLVRAARYLVMSNLAVGTGLWRAASGGQSVAWTRVERVEAPQ